MTRAPSIAARVAARARFLVRWLFRRGRLDQDLRRELEYHFEREVEDHVARGLSQTEAHAAAHREFGSVARLEDDVRDTWRVELVDRLLKDLRFGARMLLRSPGLSAVVILTLAVGIGATAALFGLFDTIRYQTITAPHPEQLYAVERTTPGGPDNESMSSRLFHGLASGPAAVGRIGGYGFRVTAGADPADSLVVQLSSDGWFDAVDAHPAFGRTWDASADRAAPLVAVISDRLWHRRFAASPAVLGQTVVAGGLPLTIAGVMPAGFTGVSLEYSTDLWVPLGLQPRFDGLSHLEDGAMNWIRVLTRLPSPDAVPPAAAVANGLLAQQRAAGLVVSDSTERLVVVPAARPELRGRESLARTFLLFTILAGAVLLIACANIANLELARGVARTREITIRLSLGASRRRLVAQLLTESALLAALGGAAGLALAGIMRRALVGSIASAAGGLTPALSGRLDLRILAFTTALTLLVALGAGLAPALSATRIDLSATLKEASLSVGGQSRRGARRALLVGQIAASLVLLTAAAMVTRALRNVERLDLGFDQRGLYQLSTDWSRTDPTGSWSEAMVLAQALSGQPGVAAVSVSDPAGFGRSTASTDAFDVAGDAAAVPHPVEFASVTPEYFAALGIAIERGRGFTTADQEGSPRVVILNRAAARWFFRGQDPIGRRFDFMGRGRSVEVVGVVAGARLHAVTDPPPPLVYAPKAQNPPEIQPAALTVEVRTTGPSASLGSITGAARAALPGRTVTVERVADRLNRSLALQRLSAAATAGFGVAGLCLAMIGLYGLNAYLTARRTAETGVRLALGASPAQVWLLVWRQSMSPVVVGVALGAVLSVVAARFFRGAIFGLADINPAVLALLVALMSAVAAMACFVPAWRASRLNPTVALRAE